MALSPETLKSAKDLLVLSREGGPTRFHATETLCRLFLVNADHFIAAVEEKQTETGKDSYRKISRQVLSEFKKYALQHNVEIAYRAILENPRTVTLGDCLGQIIDQALSQ